MVIRDRLYSAADLWALSHLSENEGKRFELSEGYLIEMTPTGGKHGGISFRLANLVGDHVETHPVGFCTAAETGYILFTDANGKDTVRAPDVGFIRAERLPDGLPDGYIPVPPDFAIEVVSPSDRADEIQKKVGEYLRYGTRLVLVVYPATQNIVAHTPSGAKTYPAGTTIDCSDGLPGFSLSIDDVF
jgi:Uma2 family endonuclease